MKHKLLYVGTLLTVLAITNPTFSQNIGVNATGAAPAASAGFDVNFTNKGLLIPRVALTATNAAGPIAAPATSLLVYNTATAGLSPNDVLPGYYYWDGAKWIRLYSGSGITYSETTAPYGSTTTRKTVVVTTSASAKVLILGEFDFSKNATASYVSFAIWRGAVEIAETSIYATANADNTIFVQWIDIPGAGTWTYTIRDKLGGGGYTTIYGSMLTAIVF